MTEPNHHPAPQRYSVNIVSLSVSLFGAPMAWCAQVNLSQALAAYACYPHRMPLLIPQFGNLTMLIVLIDIVCMGCGVGCSFLAFKNWQNVRHKKAETGSAIEVGEGRTRFLAAIAALSSLLFLTALFFTSCALLLIKPCHA